MPYYYPSYGYSDFLANNIYVLLLIPILALSLWAQFQVSGSFRRYSQQTNRRRITGAQAAEAVLRAHGHDTASPMRAALLNFLPPTGKAPALRKPGGWPPRG